MTSLRARGADARQITPWAMTIDQRDSKALWPGPLDEGFEFVEPRTWMNKTVAPLESVLRWNLDDE